VATRCGLRGDLGRPTQPAVVISGLQRSFGTRAVLRGVDLAVAQGECVAVLGPSGCGKSTLLRAVAGLDPTVGDEVRVNGSVAVVFQQPRLLPWKRVCDNVGLGLPRHGRGELIEAALAEVELSARARDWPVTLSGGEAQRAALARALVRRPAVLLLDEPFASLDALTRLRMQGLVLQLWRTHGLAMLVVTHDVDEAIVLADRAVVLDQGGIGLDVPIELPRPRRRASSAFEILRRQLLRHLGVEPDGGGVDP
jgi:sulfonate transport system ATP-binding protein